MKPSDLQALLEAVAMKTTSIADAMLRLKDLPFEDLGFARIDHHRTLRTGAPEIVLGAFKSGGEIASIIEAFRRDNQTAIVTRVDTEKSQAVLSALPDATRALAVYEELPRLLVVRAAQIDTDEGRGEIAVVTAGTSDRWVAEEAARIAELLGNRVVRVFDVGVAGLHRVLAVRPVLEAAEVVIVVAGMEGALPSVLKGLISRPIIAVPTSIGFGTGQGGFAALVGMLNACAPGITVVNIDNGFGAGYAAAVINRNRELSTGQERTSR